MGHLSKPSDVKRVPKRIMKIGMKIESEHTSIPKEQKRIVADHWVELGNAYYPELLKMERKIKQQLKSKR